MTNLESRRGNRTRPRQATLSDLHRWIVTDLCRYYRWADFITEEDIVDGVYTFHTQTAQHRYSITADEPKEGDSGFLGAIAESVHESRELTSGPLSRATWEAILRDMLALEIVPLVAVDRQERLKAG